MKAKKSPIKLQIIYPETVLIEKSENPNNQISAS